MTRDDGQDSVIPRHPSDTKGENKRISIYEGERRDDGQDSVIPQILRGKPNGFPFTRGK